MSKKFCLCVAAISLWVGQAARLAGQTPERETKTAEAKAPEPCDATTTKEDSSVTDHSIRIGGQTIPYKATASTTLHNNEKNDSTGLIYFLVFTPIDLKNISQHLVSFLYNGEPCS